MAFMEFHHAPATGFTARSEVRLDARVMVEALFGDLERSVLTLARGDRMSSLRPFGPWDRVAKLLFGVNRPNLLADPRLEALRRLAVTARRKGARAVVRETRRFLATGYTALQAASVVQASRAF